MKSMLTVRGLHKHFGEVEVVKGVDLDVAQGEVVVIIGPSGSGKSTFIRCLNSLEEPSAGSVVVDGGDSVRADDRKAMARLREDIGMVFQDYTLFPHMTVMANMILAPVKVKNRPRPTPRPMHWRCSIASGCDTRLKATRASCRADSNSASRSSARWR